MPLTTHQLDHLESRARAAMPRDRHTVAKHEWPRDPSGPRYAPTDPDLPCAFCGIRWGDLTHIRPGVVEPSCTPRVPGNVSVSASLLLELISAARSHPVLMRERLRALEPEPVSTRKHR